MTQHLWYGHPVTASPRFNLEGSPSPLPGDDRVFYTIDLCFETAPYRWRDAEHKRETALAIETQLYRDGCVGYSEIGHGWLFIQFPNYGQPVLRVATQHEIDKLPHLPDQWEDLSTFVHADGSKTGRYR